MFSKHNSFVTCDCQPPLLSYCFYFVSRFYQPRLYWSQEQGAYGFDMKGCQSPKDQSWIPK